MINAALVEAIKQLTTLLLIIALLFSPANALAGVNPVSELDKENGNCTNDYSNSSNVQDNTDSIDNKTTGGTSGNSDYSTSGQTNSNIETTSTLTPGDSETSSSGILEPNQSDDSINENDVNGNSALSDSEDLIYDSAADNDPPQYYNEPNNTDTVSKSGEDIDSQSCCSSSDHSGNALAEEAGLEPGQEQAKETSCLIDKTSSTGNDEIQAPYDNGPTFDTSPISSDYDLIIGGNSYVARVIPEDGKVVKQGIATALTVTFTELGNTSLGSAQLFIPKSLDVDTGEEVEISSGWAYKLEELLEDSIFSRVLFIWALLDGDNNNYLRKNDSVSATFTATATSDQTHHFDTKAWQEAELNQQGTEQIGVCKDDSKINYYFGYDAASDKYEENYSQPKIIVWVDSAAEGYRMNGAGPPALSMDDGSYFGNEKLINNLFINRKNKDLVGLFGYIGPGSIISNVTLVDVNITGGNKVGSLVGKSRYGVIINSASSGKVTAFGSFAGGLIGRNHNGIIKNSSVIVDIFGASIVGGLTGNNHNGEIFSSFSKGIAKGTQDVGGLVGRNAGLVENSFANVDVYANKNSAVAFGGLVGQNNNGIIKGCLATGDIYAVDIDNNKYDNVGGLVGWNRSSAKIYNSFASGTTEGGIRIGGLVGFNDSATIENTYALSDVTGDNQYGGLVGLNSLSNISNSFFLDTNHNNSNGTPISDITMKSIINYFDSSWCISQIDNIESAEHIWYIDDGNAYPLMWWQYEHDCDDNDGNDGNGENGDKPQDDDQGEPSEDDPKDAPGGNKNKRWPSSGLGNYSPGNTKSILAIKPLTEATTNQGEQFHVNQYLLVLLVVEIESNIEAIVTPEFIEEGIWQDYSQILATYKNF